MNKLQAVRKMVDQEFNFIPLSLVVKAYPEIVGWYRLTPLKPGDIVYGQSDDLEYEVIEIKENETIVIEDWIENISEVDIYDVYIENEPIFPMWGTLFHAEGFQSDWIGQNLDKVAACGFEIYEADDVDGYILGVNGAGYDFYEAHWMPLYEAQQLQWHDALNE